MDHWNRERGKGAAVRQTSLGKPSPNADFRRILLEAELDSATSTELSNWLRDIGQEPGGTVKEKIERIRQHTKYLSTPPDTFAHEALHVLKEHAAESLAEICEDLGIDPNGPRDSLLRRIYRELGYREGWLPRPPEALQKLTKAEVLPFIEWYPLLRDRKYEKDYYDEFLDEMSDVFGPDNVHKQVVVAHVTGLRIDFHIGPLHNSGVGIEFKMPTSNSELQRAKGQMNDYKARYGSDLVVVLLPDFIDNAKALLFADELGREQVSCVVKTKR